MRKITFLFLGIVCMLSVANAQETMLFDFDTVNADSVFRETWNNTWPNAAFAKVANPDATGINTSTNVGKFTANGGANALIVSQAVGKGNLPNFDFATKPYVSMKVWVNKPVSVSLEFENNGYYPSFTMKTQSVTTINQWVIVEFNCSDISYGAPGNYWGYYNIVGVSFDKDLSGGTAANDVYYFDDMKLSAASGLTTTGLSAEISAKFSVYPNPATNYILTNNAQKVTILDLNGRIVKEAFNTEKVDVSSLAKGAYIVKAQIDNATKIGKLIKK
ncbi:MAG: T9SS type A sorting domain-containing protein [Paludibacter sp.]|nr:T9SS type A sorting domain-containing protein [Paludibacter sp.]